MAPVAFEHARRGEYSVLEVALPGRHAAAAGVLLLDPSTDSLYLKLREDWEAIADPEDAEVLSLLAEDFTNRSRELGGEQLLRSLEDTLSNTLRITLRQTIAVGDFSRALNRLFERHIEGRARAPVPVIPFRTHLPLYSLRPAAGRFGQDMEVEAEDWVPAPEGLRLTDRMFVARVTGRSMEPLIPDGSLCVFRHDVTGTRQGKLVLVQRIGASETGGEFTIKRYTSRKAVTEEGWRHERIRLEPLNPEFEAWDLDPTELEGGPYWICGEFLRVLPYEEL